MHVLLVFVFLTVWLRSSALPGIRVNIRSSLFGNQSVNRALLVTRSDDGYVAISLREMSGADGTTDGQPDTDRIFPAAAPHKFRDVDFE